MRIRTLLTMAAIMLLVPLRAAAQSESRHINIGGSSGLSSGALTGGRSDVIRDSGLDIRDLPPEYGRDYDKRMQEMEEQIEERRWSDDKSAWERACELNTRASYQKYADRFPNGFHRGEAEKKIIDFDIDDIMNRDHDDLPQMVQTEEDENNPKSTLVVENHTEYTLTVMYSGFESRSIQIPAGGKTTITLINGYYRIAASVPSPYVRPYAGTQQFTGGRFETGYWINYGYR